MVFIYVYIYIYSATVYGLYSSLISEDNLYNYFLLQLCGVFSPKTLKLVMISEVACGKCLIEFRISINSRARERVT